MLEPPADFTVQRIALVFGPRGACRCGRKVARIPGRSPTMAAPTTDAERDTEDVASEEPEAALDGP